MTNSLRRRVLPAACVALALVVFGGGAAAPALAASAIHFQRESYQEFLVQLRRGEVHAVELHAQGRKVHVSLNDGGHITATYPENGQSQVVAAVRAKGVPVAVASTAPKTATVHHKLRYIAGAVLIVAILVVLVVLLIGRRRAVEGAPDGGDGEASRSSSAPPPTDTV